MFDDLFDKIDINEKNNDEQKTTKTSSSKLFCNSCGLDSDECVCDGENDQDSPIEEKDTCCLNEDDDCTCSGSCSNYK
jgi:hypothetical protein